jgi:hypothetical protein
MGGGGIGIRSINMMNVTSKGSCCSILLPPDIDVWQLKYYGGRRALASPLRGVFCSDW